MNDDRYKQIMTDLGMPNSRSLLGALQQVANEVAQEWQATYASKQKEIDANASRYLWLRNNRKLNDWWSVCGPKDMYENIDADIDAAMLESAKESLPINPEEVYSPHTKVIE